MVDALYSSREHSTNHPLFEKTKPISPIFSLKTMISQKTKPIQTQLKPKQTQFKANQTQSHEHGKNRTLRMFKLNICSNKLKWTNFLKSWFRLAFFLRIEVFVKTVAYPKMEENAAEQIKSLLGVPK